jgi:hypothetical protein
MQSAGGAGGKPGSHLHLTNCKPKTKVCYWFKPWTILISSSELKLAWSLIV